MIVSFGSKALVNGMLMRGRYFYIAFFLFASSLSGSSMNKFIFVNMYSPNFIPYSYDVSSDVWSSALTSTNPGGDDDCQITYDINNKKLIALSRTGLEYFVDAYDPVMDSWESKSTLISTQGGGMDESVAYDSESDKTILVYFSGQTIYANSYDYSTDTWTANASQGTGNHSRSALVYDSESDRMIYVIHSNTDVLTYSYDYNTDTWENRSSLSNPGIVDLGAAVRRQMIWYRFI